MRLSLLLLVAAVLVFGVVAYRVVTGGPPGPRTAAVTALGAVLLVSSVLARRRERTVVTSGTGTGAGTVR